MMTEFIKRKYFPPESEALKLNLGRAVLQSTSDPDEPEGHLESIDWQ